MNTRAADRLPQFTAPRFAHCSIRQSAGLILTTLLMAMCCRANAEDPKPRRGSYAIAKDGIVLAGQRAKFPLCYKDLVDAIGKPDRQKTGENRLLTWDDLGIVAYMKLESQEIIQVLFCYKPDTSLSFSPTTAFRSLSVGGKSLTRESSLSDVRAAGFQPDDPYLRATIGRAEARATFNTFAVPGHRESGLVSISCADHGPDFLSQLVAGVFMLGLFLGCITSASFLATRLTDTAVERASHIGFILYPVFFILLIVLPFITVINLPESVRSLPSVLRIGVVGVVVPFGTQAVIYCVGLALLQLLIPSPHDHEDAPGGNDGQGFEFLTSENASFADVSDDTPSPEPPPFPAAFPSLPPPAPTSSRPPPTAPPRLPRRESHVPRSTQPVSPPPAAPSRPILRIACPGCRRTLRVKPEVIGTRATCPACGHRFTVSTPTG